MVVLYSTKFKKQLAKAGPKIEKAFIKRRRVFQKNPTHHLLHNHKLSGLYEGFRSINITGDWRALYIETAKGDTRIAEFRLLGTHSQLYK